MKYLLIAIVIILLLCWIKNECEESFNNGFGEYSPEKFLVSDDVQKIDQLDKISKNIVSQHKKFAKDQINTADLLHIILYDQ